MCFDSKEQGRFTPTHVGNTLELAYSAPKRAVHPHTRGEYIMPACTSLIEAGSPPHTWGIQQAGYGCVALLRFTPTHVGNTRLFSQQKAQPSVHPHTRGEYVGLACRPLNTAVHPHTRGEYPGRPKCPCEESGSPPHTWGILTLTMHYSLPGRFTPTHVGNTHVHVGVSVPSAVHPHTRGEYVQLESFLSSLTGSPPHTWGIPTICIVGLLLIRFTPTHVGNTGDFLGELAPWEVHPHTRGEYECYLFHECVGVGSPPHTWGIRSI